MNYNCWIFAFNNSVCLTVYKREVRVEKLIKVTNILMNICTTKNSEASSNY